jgi:lipopolysaccharide export system protein LptC
MRARLISLMLLALLAALSIWLTQEDPEDRSKEPLVRGTDGYFLGMEVSGTDGAGELAYRLSAARAEHQPEQDAILLSGVDMILLEAGEPVWSVVAETGLAPAGGRQIQLDGGVVMRRTGPGAGMEVLGESFTLFPDSETAVSEAAVEVRMGGQILTGVGFQADFDAGSMRLLSQVHGSYTDAG